MKTFITTERHPFLKEGLKVYKEDGDFYCVSKDKSEELEITPLYSPDAHPHWYKEKEPEFIYTLTCPCGHFHKCGEQKEYPLSEDFEKLARTTGGFIIQTYEQLEQKTMEEFDEKFNSSKVAVCIFEDQGEYASGTTQRPAQHDLKHFILQAQKQAVEWALGEVELEKCSNEQAEQFCCYNIEGNIRMQDGYNQAVRDQKTKHQQILNQMNNK